MFVFMKKLLFLILILFAFIFSFADDSDFSQPYEEKVLVPFSEYLKGNIDLPQFLEEYQKSA